MRDINIDFKSSIPVYEQIKNEVKMNILNKTWKAEEQLPSIREMANLTSVNQNTIVKVYYQLDVEGFIYSKPGMGYYVKALDKKRTEDVQKMMETYLEEFLKKALTLGYDGEEIIEILKKRLKD